MIDNNTAIIIDHPEYLNKKLLVSNANQDGLLLTRDGNNILVEFDLKGLISVVAITGSFDLIPIENMSMRQLGEQYLQIADPSNKNIMKHLILPEMEVERIFNCVRYRFLTAIFLSDFQNPQQYMNAKYNKSFQALAGIKVTQTEGEERKDNDYFWQVAGFSRMAKELDWGRDIADLGRILGIFRIQGLRFDYSALYKELIAIKPGFHELMIHGDYFDKIPMGETLRDKVFRMLRGVGSYDDCHVNVLPQDMDAKAYYRYAPCHVTEAPFVFRKSLAVSYFDELCKIDSEVRKHATDDSFFVFDFFHNNIDSQQKLEEVLSQLKLFLGCSMCE